MKKVEYACAHVAEAIQKSLEVVQNGGKFISAFEMAGFIYITVEETETETERETFKGVEVDLIVVDEMSAGEPTTPAAKATAKRGKK